MWREGREEDVRRGGGCEDVRRGGGAYSVVFPEHQFSYHYFAWPLNLQ